MFIEVVTTAQTTKLVNLSFVKAIEPAEVGCAITYSDGDFISINDSYDDIKMAIDRLTGYEAATPTTETSTLEAEEAAITN
ncbi:MAG: hypothetical protein H7Z72_15080 [Bacteroidetes bacterium]|nr:hypothetical protein [Fibrella sp.]